MFVLLSPEKPCIPGSPGSFMTPGATETSEAHIKPNQTKKMELILHVPQAKGKASRPSYKTLSVICHCGPK